MYDTSSNFGNDVIFDAGVRETRDYIQFIGPGLSTLTDLEDRSTVADDGFDVLAR